MKNLSKKERTFCKLYAHWRNPKEAALKAGYTSFPELSGLKLLASPAIREQIKVEDDLHTTVKAEVLGGFRRLAFGNIGDAIRLMQSFETGEVLDPDTLDLFPISEIKRQKGGGVEIKFFDRQKALEHLESLMQYDDEDKAVPFYQALENSAKSVYSSKNGGDDDDVF